MVSVYFSLHYTIRISEVATYVAYSRHVHTMKIMRIGSKLIHNASVHTECALTAIRIECTFGQSTSIGGLNLV